MHGQLNVAYLVIRVSLSVRSRVAAPERRFMGCIQRYVFLLHEKPEKEFELKTALNYWKLIYTHTQIDYHLTDQRILWKEKTSNVFPHSNWMGATISPPKDSVKFHTCSIFIFISSLSYFHLPLAFAALRRGVPNILRTRSSSYHIYKNNKHACAPGWCKPY